MNFIPKIICIGCMKKLDKRILDSQIEVYLEWGRRYNTISLSYREWLELFATYSTKTDILDVEDEDIDYFLETAHTSITTSYLRQEARKAVERMRNYYLARTRNGLKTGRMGRPPHIGEIQKAQNYRKMGLTYKDISKLMGKNVSLVHRWIRYKLDSLKA